MSLRTIIVQNVLPNTKTAFAVLEETGEQVVVPPSVSKIVNLEIGDIVSAIIVENINPPERDPSKPPVPWFAKAVVRVAEDMVSPDEVYEVLCAYEYPVTAEEAELPIMACQQAYQQGRIVKVVAMERPQAKPIIMWCSEVDKL